MPPGSWPSATTSGASPPSTPLSLAAHAAFVGGTPPVPPGLPPARCLNPARVTPRSASWCHPGPAGSAGRQGSPPRRPFRGWSTWPSRRAPASGWGERDPSSTGSATSSRPAPPPPPPARRPRRPWPSSRSASTPTTTWTRPEPSRRRARWPDVDDTGRIRRPLTPSARRIVFGEPAPGPSELALVTQVDRAHLVMLAEQGLVGREAAGALLVEIEVLRAGRFAPLDGAEARRGRYLLYEDWLVSRLGERTAGILRTGRSRNDLNATVLLLRLRPPVERLLVETLRLQATLLAGARRHAGTVMPGYTHYQPAVPTTYGHHLGGVARALDRDLEALGAAAAGPDTSPLGA